MLGGGGNVMGEVSKVRRGETRAEGGGEKVVVAVKASKEIPSAAALWALTHVVQPGDSLTLLVVVPHNTSGRKLWGFPRFAGDCASGQKKLSFGTTSEQKSEINEACSRMIHQLHNVNECKDKIIVKVKIVSGSPTGAVVAEAKRVHANWVVLDRQLKHEEKRCMEELQCSIVVMKRSQAKVLRLNLVGSPETDCKAHSMVPSEMNKTLAQTSKNSMINVNPTRVPAVTPSSSPEVGTPFTATEAGTSSISSSDPGASPFFITLSCHDIKKGEKLASKEIKNLDVTSSESGSGTLSPTSLEFHPWMEEILNASCMPSKRVDEASQRLRNKAQVPLPNMLCEKFSRLGQEARINQLNYRSDSDRGGSFREVISLSRNAPPGPPPLCSICQHKAPVFGKPPRWFSYAELELATGGFSQANFLAEGGFGSVHRGLLADGQAIAVKQHKLASSQGDHEFCSEVEVLSCAQHRNVVMLIGFCVENRRRLLVYEYICNGSLDSHLYGHHYGVLEWSARQKVAVGAARGLRYLHEECRVGCIVHRDMRPNNILLTHDFEPLVGDFGLARWQPDGDLGVETRVIGTFGYLAPEYAQSGQITEKADVYSFGVVLIELITGRKAVDINRPKGQQCLTEWARPLLEEYAIDELVDPRLGNHYNENEVYCMLHVASLCIRRDPHTRPRMSQVLRILEGDIIMESSCGTTPYCDPGNRSGRMWPDRQPRQHYSDPLPHDNRDGRGKECHETLKSSYRLREKAQTASREYLVDLQANMP